jgi:hypothetical protein
MHAANRWPHPFYPVSRSRSRAGCRLMIGRNGRSRMCARVGPAHMRPLPAKRMDGTEGRCVRAAHMRPFPANAMAGNRGKCVRAAHMWPFRASRSRTCGLFRPESRPADGKPGEVREPEAEKWQGPGGSACETPGNRGMCARTSAGFVPSGRKTGRNQGEVRGSLARTKGMCVRVAHMRLYCAKGTVGNKGMCVRATHMRPLRAKGMAESRGMCVRAAHMRSFRATSMARDRGMCASGCGQVARTRRM